MVHSKARPPSTLSILGAIGVGAALMYFFDPQTGRRRRALLRDQWEHTTRKLQEGQRVVMRDASNRAHGFMAEANRLVKRGGKPDDEVLVERVRAALGREVSHPHPIEVHADEGTVTLSGAILAHEVDNLISCVKHVRGVKDVENRLSVFDEPGNIPSLQGGVEREGHRPEFLQANWSPSARTAAGGFGAMLAVFGFLRGGLGGLALGALGSGLLARAATNRDVKSIVGMGPECQGVRVQKAIHIDAPVERVFETWADFENFSQWMSHVRWVRPEGGNRYHWLVDGPAGVPVEWHSELCAVEENRQMAWRSIPGSMVEHSGRVLFEPDPNGGTRVQVELCYVPIAGAIGHALAKAFGADPKSEMDADLMRFKTRIETGNPPHDAAARRAPNLGAETPLPGMQRH
jgi:uncharacterized membrane protein